MIGYFKVHRKILESQVFAHQTALKIWIWCLAKVSYKEHYVAFKVGRGETTVKLLPGQFIFGRFKAEEELNIDGSTIYKWMLKFSSAEFEMITIESNNQYSIVTICKWEEYQNLDYFEVTANGQPSISHGIPLKQQCNTYKNDNKDKNEIILNIPFESFWNLYDKKVDMKKCKSIWKALTNEERTSCIKNIPAYFDANPVVKYRRNPEKYLINKSWENEIVKQTSDKAPQVKPAYNSGPGR